MIITFYYVKTMVFSEGIHLVVEGKIPTVLVLHPLQFDKRSSGKVTLVCLVRGLLGAPTHIIWKVNGQTLPEEDTFSEITKETDGTNAAIGLLYLAVSDWNPKNTYTCTVIQGSKLYEGSMQASACQNLH
uniref:Ig-like domain-containing protein n=1 Tax=Scleropages formosus TaxID=113540 RepID=A0A8C9SI00_SCLFO